MRIGFFGCGGSGKTTLVQYLCDTKIVTEPFLQSCVRKVARRHGIVQDRDFLILSSEKILDCQTAIFMERMIEEKTYEGFISDRTLIDVFLHTLLRCHMILNDQTLARMKSLVDKSNQKYDYLFYTELPDHLFFDDKSRIQTYASIYVLETLYLDFLVSYKEKMIHVLPWDTLENRVQKVQEIIGDKTHNVENQAFLPE